MIAQDLTKFTLVLVILGIVLAIAIFRPQVFRPPPIEPTKEPEPGEMIEIESGPELGEREEGVLSREDLLAWQEKLERRERELERRETEFDERQRGLDQRQAELDGREAELNRRQMELGQLEAELNQYQAELEGRKAGLEKQVASQQATEARLREWQASLAAQEQKLQGFRRWSVVAVVVSGLLAVPSVLALMALTRQGQRERVTQYGRPTEATSAPTFSDNGRDRERVRHRR